MIFFVAALGLIVGSFLNVLIWRLNDEKAPKFWQGRSICPHCKKKLFWYDNIPLLSFILLSGHCRYCQKKISWQYPLVELVSATAFVVIGWQPWLLVLAVVFIVIFFSDLIYGLIPDEMIVVGSVIVIASVAKQSSFDVQMIASSLALLAMTGVGAAAFFFLIVLVTKFRGMGLGDVKLAFLMGFFLGWPRILVAFWAAFVLGGIVALILLLLKKVRFSDKIAFGPWLILGTLLATLLLR